MRPIVYVSGPITKGCRASNLHQGHVAHEMLMRTGFAPINPILSMHLPFAWCEDFPHPLWMECDLPLVAVSAAVLRLPGDSVGADAEVDFAQQHGIPVFHRIEDLWQWSHENRKEADGDTTKDQAQDHGDAASRRGPLDQAWRHDCNPRGG